MLMPIKTCYNIHISSKSLVNQASARAALTQIINTILQRFDTSYEDAQASQTTNTSTSNKLNVSINNDTLSISSDLNDDSYERYVAIIRERDELNENSDEVADLMISMLNTLNKNEQQTRKMSDDMTHASTPNGSFTSDLIWIGDREDLRITIS
jgi:hypothetical protein